MRNKKVDTETSIVGGNVSIVNNTSQKIEMANNNSKENNVCDIISVELRDQMREIRQDVLNRLNDRMDDMVSEVLKKIEKALPINASDGTDSRKHRDKIKSLPDVLPVKEFVTRNSVLTDLYEVSHIRTIYNVSFLILVVLLVNNAVTDIRETGWPKLCIDTLRSGFGKFSIVLYIWFLMKAMTFGLYGGYRVWVQQRLEYSAKPFVRKVWDYSWLIALISHQIIFLVFPTKMLLKEDLPIASSFVVLMEQIRLIMKMYAFVRSTSPRFLSYKPHSDTAIPKAPSFTHFLYFMFAPTLVYRDSYPTTKKIRWKAVENYVAEFIGIIFCVALIYEAFLYSPFWQSGTKPLELDLIVAHVIRTLIPAALFLLCGFYCLLHCWQNMFAEILCFADRMFYEDWWNATTYKVYYRTWNVVVYDWLYEYIYKDMYEIVTRRNKFLSIFTVILISAVVHEYILSFALRFFYPVMFILFTGPGFVLPTRPIGNVMLWLGVSVGTSIMMCLYAIEYFARINCPSHRDDWLDLFLPRTWMCSTFP